MLEVVLYVVAGLACLLGAAWLYRRIQLSLAKHRSIGGHPKNALRLARHIRFYEYSSAEVLCIDGAPVEIERRRKSGVERLEAHFDSRASSTNALAAELEDDISDLAFTNSYRVPFQFRSFVKTHFRIGTLVDRTEGVRVRDLDGNWSYDLTGAYGMNVFGYDFYKSCIERGVEKVRDLGPFLGSYHPVIADNVARLKAISGMDEVSFHMSGTEAVMQAVRLARYHTGRSHLVRFCGSYHGWWDGVQPGIGNPREVNDVHTLADMSQRTLGVLRTRNDIACVLVNPIQAMHPNAGAPSDSTLVTSGRKAGYDRAAYTAWLKELREVCTKRGIVLILDEVFLGFRLAYGGAQEYFGVRADLVTYGKTLGGGLPIGVVCGRRELMKRFRDDRPSDICFARGTFNSHPYVMGAMNEFLHRIAEPGVREEYARLDDTWNARARSLNARLEASRLPLRVVNMSSVWTTIYLVPSAYNWMFQFYLRAEGLALSWVGSGRLVFSHNYTDADFAAVADRFVAAAVAANADGWWWQAATVTNRSIKRRVLRDLIAARFGWKRRARDERREPLVPVAAPRLNATSDSK